MPLPLLKNCNEAQEVAEMKLLITLPKIDDFTHTGIGKPLVAKADAWMTYTEKKSETTSRSVWL